MQHLLAYCHVDPFKVAQSICDDIVLNVNQANLHNESEVETKLGCLYTVFLQCKHLSATSTENVASGSGVNSQSECTSFDKAALSICIPLFKQKTNFGNCTALCMRLIDLIHPFLSAETLDTLFTELQQSLDSDSSEDIPKNTTDIEAGDAVHILSRLFSENDTATETSMSSQFRMEHKSTLSNWQHKYITKVLEILPNADEKLFSSLSTKLLPKLLGRVEHGERIVQFDAVWALIWGIFQAHGQETFNPNRTMTCLSEQPYALICALADWLFLDTDSSGVMLNLLSKAEFWLVLQSGFNHSNSLTRKQAMYLLKRILDTLEKSDMAVNTNSMSDDVKFWWHPETKKDVSNVWNDYILLMETLEEKQVCMMGNMDANCPLILI